MRGTSAVSLSPSPSPSLSLSLSLSALAYSSSSNRSAASVGSTRHPRRVFVSRKSLAWNGFHVARRDETGEGMKCVRQRPRPQPSNPSRCASYVHPNPIPLIPEECKSTCVVATRERRFDRLFRPHLYTLVS